MATSIATFPAILKFCATKNLFKQIHKYKTNTLKQHLYQKHNSHFLWGTIAKLSKKETATIRKSSIHFRTKTAFTNINKAKAFNKKFTK